MTVVQFLCTLNLLSETQAYQKGCVQWCYLGPCGRPLHFHSPVTLSEQDTYCPWCWLPLHGTLLSLQCPDPVSRRPWLKTLDTSSVRPLLPIPGSNSLGSCQRNSSTSIMWLRSPQRYHQEIKVLWLSTPTSKPCVWYGGAVIRSGLVD